MKVVLDSSVLVSAFLTRGNTTGTLLQVGLDGRFEICLSRQILEETERNLLRSRLRRRYRYDRDEVSRFIADLVAGVTIITQLPAIEPVCRDPEDDHVLAAALAVDADCIVTGDHDLLDLAGWQGIRISTVRTFLDSL